MFNTILRAAEFQLTDVRLLRHRDPWAEKGRSPYELWRDDLPKFELYQATQRFSNRSKLNAPYWASFVVTPSDETLFVGMYIIKSRKVLDKDLPMPHADGVDKAGTCDFYDLVLQQELGDLIGKLLIDWGEGYKAWIQHADRQDKQVIELRKEFQEPAFPGILDFRSPLSQMNKIPRSWIAILEQFKGIYVLTCPKTKEHYVGKATGEKGFWQRLLNYIQTGHGGNVGLKNRPPSDYQVAILEVAGSASTDHDIIDMEERWISKLQSQKMGLNR